MNSKIVVALQQLRNELLQTRQTLTAGRATAMRQQFWKPRAWQLVWLCCALFGLWINVFSFVCGQLMQPVPVISATFAVLTLSVLSAGLSIAAACSCELWQAYCEISQQYDARIRQCDATLQEFTDAAVYLLLWRALQPTRTSSETAHQANIGKGSASDTAATTLWQPG